MSSIIGVRGLTKRFAEHIVLDNISFDIEEGSIFGLIGKSGCGKTTLLNLMIGFLKPNRGNIYYRGRDINKVGNELGKYFGFASQEGSFYKKLNVIENIAYFGRLYGLGSKDVNNRTKILLEIFDLENARDTLGHNLSIGMQKRLDIACSLIHDPEILILDEPTANLDPTLRKSILELIRKINYSGTTVIISSHILDDISNLCDTVLVIDDKRVIALDSPENLEHGLSSLDTIKLESELKNYDVLIGNLLNRNLINDFKLEDNNLFLYTSNTKNALKHISSHFSKGNDHLVHINIIKPSLGNIFEGISGEKTNERNKKRTTADIT